MAPMPQGRKKANIVAEPWRKKGRGQFAVRGTYTDVGLSNPVIMFKAWFYRYYNMERLLTKLRSSKETRLQHRLVGSLRGLLPGQPKVIRLRPFGQQHTLTVVSNLLLSPNKLPLVPSSLQTKGSQASNPVKFGRILAAATLERHPTLTPEREFAADQRKLLGLLSRPHKNMDQVISVVLPALQLARPLNPEHAKIKFGVKVPKLI